jgi:hypothetical protein
MITVKNISKSTKHVGKYEKELIQTLADYFRIKGYEVIPHSSLNIAWGSVISDVDLLLIKNQLLTYIEVKSTRDKIGRAKQQIERIKDYVDYAYVATNKYAINFEMNKVGLIKIREDKIEFIKKAKRFSNKPSFYSVATLKKKCLFRFLGTDAHYLSCISKYELAQSVYAKGDSANMRKALKEIVTCGDLCASSCPLSLQGKTEPILPTYSCNNPLF